MDLPAEQTGAPPRRRGGGEHWLVLGTVLAVTASSLVKPVHIDDTLYLNIARWIVRHPLDPYGGTLNWQQVPEPAYAVSISPPLLSYVFAAVIAVAGENVVLLHAAMIPWVVLACWALAALGRRWAGSAGPLLMVVMLGPAVLAGMNLMLDVPLLACSAAAVECLMRGLEQGAGRWWWFLAAAGLGAAGVLIKFPALALVPVFLAAAATRRRWGPLLAAAGPVAALLAWQAVSRSLYGAGQVQAGLSFLGQFRTEFARQILERSLSMCAILALTFPVWIVAPLALKGLRRLGAGLLALGAIVAAGLFLGGRLWQHPWHNGTFLAGAGLGAFAMAAGVARSTSPAEGKRTADDPHLLLWVWMLSILAIVLPFAPFVAVRSFLPLQPPLALLLLRRVRTRAGVVATVVVSALLGTGLAVADTHWAACYPAAVQRISKRYGPTGRPIVFLGHWGWQYYAERAEFRPWDARWREAPPGAIVVVPLRADRQWIDPAVLRRLSLLDRIEVPPAPLGLTTWNRSTGIRFYGGDYGELPWGFSPEPAEVFHVFAAPPRRADTLAAPALQHRSTQW